jgi:hypothetical protein
MRPTALDSESDSELTDRLALEMAEEPSELLLLPEEKSETPLDRSDRLLLPPLLLLFRFCNRVATAAVPAATGTSYSSPVVDKSGGLSVPPLELIATNRGVS